MSDNNLSDRFPSAAINHIWDIPHAAMIIIIDDQGNEKVYLREDKNSLNLVTSRQSERFEMTAELLGVNKIIAMEIYTINRTRYAFLNTKIKVSSHAVEIFLSDR